MEVMGIRMEGFCLVLTSLLVTALSIQSTRADVLEACAYEKLKVECPDDHVILLDHARYGRLHLGKCVTQNFGFLGCMADVMRQIDPLCSGRQKCELGVFSTLQNQRPEACKELDAFLQIEFTCIPVVPLPRQQCSDRVLTVREDVGYLPSFHAYGEPVITGRQGCTVELVAQRGQIWNLTLLDFGEPDSGQTPESSELTGRQKESIWCTRYGAVMEMVDGTEKRSTVCGNSESQSRQRSFYLSTTNTVTVELNLEVLSTYLIEFKVVGCAIPDTPNIVHVKADGDKHTFHCNATGESWTLICKGSHWQGHHKACGTVPKTSEFRTTERDWNSTTGLVIVVGLGLVLGIIIGSSLLGLVVCYYRRRYKSAGPTVQQIYGGPTYGSQHKDNNSMYKRYDPEPARQPSTGEYDTKPANPSDTYKYPYQSCRPSIPYLANLPEPMVATHMPSRGVTCGTPARLPPRSYIDEELMPSHVSTGAGTHYGRSTSDTSSNSDHVYEIPS